MYGGYFDKEFAEWTELFFDEVDDGLFKIVHSSLIDTELKPAPKYVRDFAKKYTENSEIALITRKVVNLAKTYISEGVIGKKHWVDCIHIAAASIAGVNVLVSWNFRHVVNRNRILGYNRVNEKNGYSVLDIRTPGEVLNYG
ncbi:hypothetical protein LEP1GSC188_4855 [Leptospira weilii serovar Topaz str. LT2116]|uniref:PIN domain protein n=1 Tax=Leptospira weilii serovar Topaz str. LT2116 TaxID=1088540 RepID=M3EG54_9LEPT|nr:hypothetical protein LEP1GSC188_4855 [Leptospira weilii serovar Topaz str. LT2116]